MTLVLDSLSFADNIRPSEVTASVREQLVRRELARATILVALPPVFALIIAGSLWFAHGFGDPKPTWTLEDAYLIEVGVLGLVVAIIVWFVLRRIHFIRHAFVTKGVVVDVEIPEWQDQETITGKISFRFLPTELRDSPDTDLLKEEVPHFKGQAKVEAHWGSFGADLRPGSLVSVLYDAEKPTRTLIVPLKRT